MLADNIYNTQLIIDVGGSGLQVYEKNIGYNAKIILDLEIPSDSSLINQWLYRLVESLSPYYSQIILGIPGPVDQGKEDVFCPPLNVTIDLNPYRAKGIQVVNDTIAHLVACWNKTMSRSKRGAILTVGTSLGLCTYFINHNTGELDMSKVKSHEIAHDNTIFYSKQIEPPIYPTVPTTLGAVFSMAGLLKLFNQPTIPIANGLCRASKRITESIIPDLACSEIFSLWLEGLNLCVKKYLRERSLQKCVKQLYISGGIASISKYDSSIEKVIKSSGFKLLEAD